jgi:DNA helicase-2/ATP-dependent DNA helicase PcrA
MTINENINPLTPKYTPEQIIAKLQAHPKFGSQIKPITKHQSAIISSGLEPAVVIAGAGSGKTETMSNRVLYLVANGYATPDQILGLTFTRKAAGELSVRIRKRLRQLSQLPEFKHITSNSTAVTTYHSYAGKLLSEHAIRYGIDADAEPLGEAAIWQIASDVVRNWSDDSYRNDSAVSTVIKDLLGLSKFMLEHQVKAADIEVIGNEMLAQLQSLAGSTNEDTRAVARAMRQRNSLLPMVEAFMQRRKAAAYVVFVIWKFCARNWPPSNGGGRPIAGYLYLARGFCRHHGFFPQVLSKGRRTNWGCTVLVTNNFP